MPADYISTAQALSLPISPFETSSPSPTSTPGPLPPWARTRSGSGANRRLSTPYSRPTSTDAPLGARILQTSTDLVNRSLKVYLSLSPLQRIIASVASVIIFVVIVLALVYSHRIFAALSPIAKGWRNLPAGWLLVGLMSFCTAFPPIIGYSTSVTIAGFVYGFPGGWPIVACSTILGSTAAFFTSRGIFSGYVHALVGTDKRFVALGHVLQHDGVLVLAAIRFCPLPYSLSNGFLATIPSVSLLSFALATAMATPKLLILVFIGSRLALLAETGDEMTAGDKAINYLSMALFGVLGVLIGLVIYRRTMARAEDLDREDTARGGRDSGINEFHYEDLEEGTLGRESEVDAAALMDDDDISLWETDGVELEYRDVTDRDALRDGVKDDREQTDL
ncbi:uncharacterized protein BCR38DRAFT_437642 [Pseudomassariella vexata]|uniref:Golgi apparatus membrane protein TVP38 n=1 Tax=Pseudomassariella vexata TaxID=1141098 RepID=A0A1Y2DS90_9PEZI|nr:uncharacterized protein BCR38DRAFT_437642 [Pseudomassariella vexata]ORY62141.1 hypothetical protein BCR38DRAFT_437642 [Pseudomassariella vexata]